MPAGETLVGTWSVDQNSATVMMIEISYPVPLESPATVVYVHEAGENATECPGEAAEPKAAEGFLCIYRIEGLDTSSEFGPVSFPFGAFMAMERGVAADVGGWGTWAVTAG